LAYLPVEHAREGTPVKIEIFGEMTPARVSARVLYDPRGRAVKS
jgi:glycine cleavage system aminomethyltransferase T